MQHLKNCPICNCNWDGGDVFEELQLHYPDRSIEKIKDMASSYGWSEENPQRFSNLIGIEVLGEYDGISRWQCPCCKSEWDRFTEKLLIKQPK